MRPTVFKPMPDAWCENIIFDEDYAEFPRGIGQGNPFPDWKNVCLGRLPGIDDEDVLVADTPYWESYGLVMREKAVQVLLGLFGPHGQFLPFTTDGGQKLFLFNTTTTIDALDEGKSEIEYVNGHVWKIEKYEFNAPIVKGPDVFRLPLDSSPTFFSEKVVKTYLDAGLKGWSFHLLWSEGGIERPVGQPGWWEMLATS